MPLRQLADVAVILAQLEADSAAGAGNSLVASMSGSLDIHPRPLRESPQQRRGDGKMTRRISLMLAAGAALFLGATASA